MVQLKAWLLGISPMVWRRVQVPGTCTLHELQGVIQVAMGWEGIHLNQLCLGAKRLGSSESSASSPDVAKRDVSEADWPLGERLGGKQGSIVPALAPDAGDERVAAGAVMSIPSASSRVATVCRSRCRYPR